jgi:hypothetical protein
MPSTVDILNRGLQKLGAKRIISLSEESKNARACAVVWEPILYAELTDHPWSCAIKRVEIAADDPTPDFGRANSFTLPADYLRLLKPDPAYNTPDLDFQVEGRKIFTDWAGPIQIRYIYKITDPNEMDALLIEALSAKAAFELCEEITQSNTKKEALRKDYEDTINRAKRTNAIIRIPQESAPHSWVTCRE